jgi:mono/diheme cytochrome c family protein
MRKEAMLIAWLAWSGCEDGGAVGFDERRLEEPASRARGRTLFREHCALCHGERADGRGVRRQGLVGTPADFTSPGWRERAEAGRVFQTIREGSPGTSMAAWRVLGDDAISDLTSYVLSVREEGP